MVTIVMARVNAKDRERTHERLLEAAGRAFRLHGYGGAGVDAVAMEAGVTSGAFYAHFGSKLDLFRSSLSAGLGQLRTGIELARERHGARWLQRFAGWYLGADRRSDLAGSCALPTLSLEAARSDAATRAAYTGELRALIADVQSGLAGSRREGDAIAILALLCGGMVIAHAVDDERLGSRIAKGVADAIVLLGEQRGGVADGA
jgi:AcrR family transcriptional regulator